ncbi:hypothetical protein L3X38_002484 [Prunus dulcis]|uniref:Uncharacterized protein n=1 Tax=Prunus dulcis TaxID=3755 RepID=A0AAD4ZL40_PRUDU|nr:hypothetical protein L3X38_002484 [Prunus dulcis]
MDGPTLLPAYGSNQRQSGSPRSQGLVDGSVRMMGFAVVEMRTVRRDAAHSDCKAMMTAQLHADIFKDQ